MEVDSLKASVSPPWKKLEPLLHRGQIVQEEGNDDRWKRRVV